VSEPPQPTRDPKPHSDPGDSSASVPTETGLGPTVTHHPRPDPAGPDRPAAHYPEIPGCEILGELGRGGMGVVYRARQASLNRPVAVKMLLAGRYTDAVAQARFLVEAEVVARLRHPHVVQVYEFGRTEDQPYFVLEFVGGASLAGKLKAEGQFVPRGAAEMVATLADAMAAAHAQGIIHRDLKPANVLLTEVGEPKIADFGLAKLENSEVTASGAIMGTPSYMSPEQAAGQTRQVGTSTDV
jgi:serine/threonine protein kinase